LQSHLTAQNIKIPDISKNTSATSSVNNASYPVKGTRLQVSVAFAKLAVAKVHSKIRRVRDDFLHKLSRKTVNENKVIVVENLAVKNMVKNHRKKWAERSGGLKPRASSTALHSAVVSPE
jgi:hypothetical protein